MKKSFLTLTLLLLCLVAGTCLAQTPLDYVMSHREKVKGRDRLSVDLALLERLMQLDRLTEAQEFVQSLEPEMKSQLVFHGAVSLDETGKHQEAFDWVSSLLPTGSFEDVTSIRRTFLKGATTAEEAESRVALLQQKDTLKSIDLALAVATYEGEKEPLAVLSRELSARAPKLDPLPLVKVYEKVASFGLPEADDWAREVESRVDELGFDKWSELYFSLPAREATTLALLEERLMTEVEEQSLSRMLDLFFQAQVASRPLEVRLVPKLDAIVTDQPLERLDSFSQVPDLTLYLGFREEDEFANQLIATLDEMLEQGIDAAEQRGESPDRVATARQGMKELRTQMRVGVAAGLWCAGRQDEGLAMAVEECGDEAKAFTRMAEQTLGKLDCYYDLARLVPDEAVEVWAPAAASQMSERIDVTYWMDRVRASASRKEAAPILLRFPGLPGDVREELATFSRASGETGTSDKGDAELKALESLAPETDGWTLVLLSILALDSTDLTAAQRERLEEYCREH